MLQKIYPDDLNIDVDKLGGYMQIYETFESLQVQIYDQQIVLHLNKPATSTEINDVFEIYINKGSGKSSWITWDCTSMINALLMLERDPLIVINTVFKILYPNNNLDDELKEFHKMNLSLASSKDSFNQFELYINVSILLYYGHLKGGQDEE